MQQSTGYPSTIPEITEAFLSPESLMTTVFFIGLLLAAILYVVFAIVIVRQVKIMNKTISTPLGPVIQLLAWLHLVFALVLAGGIFFIL